ncbi:hypothetical protein [Photorhabdus africana]|nr:hypothetical protein [Photorhabdus sp. CRI-LC]
MSIYVYNNAFSVPTFIQMKAASLHQLFLYLLQQQIESSQNPPHALSLI